MAAKWPLFGGTRIDGNDSRHNLADPNRGGGPAPKPKAVAPALRGGTGHNGQRVHVQAGMSGARGGSGNPASRGGFSGQARGGAFQPDKRVPGHGGSPQHRGGAGSGADFGRGGQTGVPGGNSTQPKPGAGNTGGRAYRLIAGRFKRAAMGASASQGDSGGWGRNPITSNT